MAKKISARSEGQSGAKSWQSRETWIRGLFMVLFAVIWGIAEVVLLGVVVFQFGSMVLVGKTNERLLGFGKDLARFIYEVTLFFTYNSEDKPFPFGPWPQETARKHKPSGAAKQSA